MYGPFFRSLIAIGFALNVLVFTLNRSFKSITRQSGRRGTRKTIDIIDAFFSSIIQVDPRTSIRFGHSILAPHLFERRVPLDRLYAALFRSHSGLPLRCDMCQRTVDLLVIFVILLASSLHRERPCRQIRQPLLFQKRSEINLGLLNLLSYFSLFSRRRSE